MIGIDYKKDERVISRATGSWFEIVGKSKSFQDHYICRNRDGFLSSHHGAWLYLMTNERMLKEFNGDTN